MVCWKVKITKKAEEELKTLLRQEIISKEDINVLLRWVDEMEEFGPDFIAKSPQWHDHSLEREWYGYRSSAFSSAGRVVYKIKNQSIVVEVHRVTPDHNYIK